VRRRDADAEAEAAALKKQLEETQARRFGIGDAPASSSERQIASVS
jgi:hypothetical protein